MQHGADGDLGEHLRIYIDTSVLGGCFDPEFAPWSNGLVRDFRAGRLVHVLSDVTAAEVASAPDPVRDLHQEMLALAGEVLPLTAEALGLVAKYGLPGAEYSFPEGGDHL